MKRIPKKLLSIILCLAIIASVSVSVGKTAFAVNYAEGWSAPSGYSSTLASQGKYAVKVVFYGYGDTFKNNSGNIWLEYYSDNGTGTCTEPYRNYSLPSDVWNSSTGASTEMNTILSGFPCHASCSFDITITGGAGFASKEGGIFMAMYVYSIDQSKWIQVGNGSGVSVKASGGMLSGSTKTSTVNASVSVNEDSSVANTTYSGMMPSLDSAYSIKANDITVDENNYLQAESTVSVEACDQYGVSIVKKPDLFSLNTNSSENLSISDISNTSKRVSASYKTNSQDVSVNAEYILGKPKIVSGNYFDCNKYCSQKTYATSASFGIINNTSSLTAIPSFTYYKSNEENPSEPVSATLKGSAVLKNTDTVKVPEELVPVPDYYDCEYHYTSGTFGEISTISDNTEFVAKDYKREEHNLVLKSQQPSAGSDGKVYFGCECGYKCGAKYNGTNYVPDKSKNYTPISCAQINAYKSDAVDYTLRGASLREEKRTENKQYMRFTASAKFPENAEIVDFGFILTRSKYLFGNEPVNNKPYNSDEFVIGKENVYDYPLYSEKGNYTLHGDGTYTFNLVVNISSENWKIHYATRSYVSYIYNGMLVTVYDDTYSSRTVGCVAQRVYDSATASSSEKGYVNKNILSKYKTDLKMLSQSGRDIVNSDGKVVQLTGVNLGGWLLQEAWMTPVNKSDSDKWGQWNTDNILKERFGNEGKEQLLDVYKSNWITEEDLDYLKELGANCVRVPFWYGNFINSDDSLDWKRDETGNIDFSYLDWIVSECAQRNIYVILDLHGAMGFQSTNHSCGKCESMKLFESSESNKYIELNKSLWKEIASRYKDNPAVAGYDILNEALNNDDGKEDGDREKLIAPVYDAFYDAIREVDANHLIIMEGIWNVGALPKVTEYSWKNVAYSCHNYNYQTSEIDDKISWYDSDTTRYSLIPSNTDYWVPMIVGEFQPGEILDYVCGKYNNAFKYTKKTADYGFSWLTWSYKGTGGLASSTWFMRSGTNVEDVNLESDSFQTILKKWGSALRTENAFAENTVLTKGSDGKSKGLSSYYIALP